MNDFVLESEIEALLDLLEECWAPVIRTIDGSDISTVREMVDKSRGQVPKGDILIHVFRDLAFDDGAIFSKGRNGLHAAFLLAFGYVAGLKLESENGPVKVDSELATGAFLQALVAHDRILGAGREERVAKARNAALKRAETLYGEEKALVRRLLSTRAGDWISKREALDWIDDHLTKTGRSRLTYDNRRDTLERWLQKDPAFQLAYEEGLRLGK